MWFEGFIHIDFESFQFYVEITLENILHRESR